MRELRRRRFFVALQVLAFAVALAALYLYSNLIPSLDDATKIIYQGF